MTVINRNISIQRAEKEFLEVFNKLCYSRSAWQVWADVMSAIACSLSNAADRTPQHFEQREKEYTQCIKRLGSVEAPAKILCIITMALEKEPEQDFLGKMYMSLNLSNHWKGQFFTPYSICKMMSQLTVGNADRLIEKQGYISICDPACGAGATLIAAANTIKGSKYNFQNHVLFVGQDIDRIVAQMCYIQLSLLGCAGYICVGNTITDPITGPVLFPQEKEGLELWYMPMFYADVWQYRKMFYLPKSINGTVTAIKTVEKEHFYMFFYFTKRRRGMGSEGFEGNLSKVGEAPSVRREDENGTQDGRTVKYLAEEKLKKEMKAAKDKSFVEPIIGYLLERCREDEELAEDVVQEHKTWQKCFDYIYEQARKQMKGNCAAVRDNVVYEWAEDYYHKDDKVEKTPVVQKAVVSKELTISESSKSGKNRKAMDGQMDIFALMEYRRQYGGFKNIKGSTSSD